MKGGAGGLVGDGPRGVVHRPGGLYGIVRDTGRQVDPDPGLTFDLGDGHDTCHPCGPR